MLGQGCTVFEVFVFEGSFVAAVPGLEVLSAPYIFVWWSFSGYGFIDNVFSQAVAIQGTAVFLAFLAVTFLFWCLFFVCYSVEEFSVVSLDGCSNVACAAVRQFYGVTVEDSVEWALPEVLVYQR